eukprot:262719-Chlamydomonas_euryale.AAC.1
MRQVRGEAVPWKNERGRHEPILPNKRRSEQLTARRAVCHDLKTRTGHRHENCARLHFLNTRQRTDAAVSGSPSAMRSCCSNSCNSSPTAATALQQLQQLSNWLQRDWLGAPASSADR